MKKILYLFILSLSVLSITPAMAMCTYQKSTDSRILTKIVAGDKHDSISYSTADAANNKQCWPKHGIGGSYGVEVGVFPSNAPSIDGRGDVIKTYMSVDPQGWLVASISSVKPISHHYLLWTISIKNFDKNGNLKGSLAYQCDNGTDVGITRCVQRS